VLVDPLPAEAVPPTTSELSVFYRCTIFLIPLCIIVSVLQNIQRLIADITLSQWRSVDVDSVLGLCTVRIRALLPTFRRYKLSSLSKWSGWVFVSKSHCNWRSARQFVLVPSPIQWRMARFCLLSRQLHIYLSLGSPLTTGRVCHSSKVTVSCTN
jgi:hypothetical protein